MLPAKSLLQISSTTTINDLYAQWLIAEGDARFEILMQMRPLLVVYAARIYWITLRQENDHLCQEMVDDLLLTLDKFRGDSKFSTFAHACFRNKCINELRYQKTSLGDSLDALSEAGSDEAVATEDIAETYFGVQEYLDTLSDTQREIVEMKLEGLLIREITERTGVPRSTVDRIWKSATRRMSRRENSGEIDLHLDDRLSMAEVLDELPVREREVVEARLEGHTFKEITAMTSIPETTVKRIWGGVCGSE